MHCFYFILFFETGFLCTLGPVLELVLVDQAGFELTELRLPLTPSAGIKVVRHQHPAVQCYFEVVFVLFCSAEGTAFFPSLLTCVDCTQS